MARQVTALFSFEIESILRAPSIDFERRKLEMSFSLDLTPVSESLADCITHFMRPEHMNGNNQWRTDFGMFDAVKVRLHVRMCLLVMYWCRH